MPNFLLEIGAEEIPDWMIESALSDLKNGFEKELGVLGGDALRLNATPRRLVLRADNLAERAPDTQNVTLGPYLSAGAGAGQGFARKWNTTVEALAKTADAKGERYVFHQHLAGEPALQLLSAKLPQIITAIRFPKAMYWTDKGGVRFIRPIRWIVALLDDSVVPFELAGISSGNVTRGHRILGEKQPVEITLENYEQRLRENFVLLQETERQVRIEAALVNGAQADGSLLRTLIYMTEFPTPIRGSFDPAYLQLPKEILTTVMRHHQRYFSVLKEGGSLAPEFIAVTNTFGDPEGLIQQGNERVLRARFNDARFFWEADQKRRLIDRVADLEKVTFQAKLGSYKEKTERVVELATFLAEKAGADVAVVQRAATLAKCDLTTDMVKEFTELQGVVGGLYAQSQGEGDAVATAVYDHYQPVSMDDGIPRTLEGQIVAIADKLDTLRECFRLGLIPTGSRDPFALRRAAQGVIKIFLEARLSIDIFGPITSVPELRAFLGERFTYYLREVKGYPYDEVNSVVKRANTLFNALDRLEALHQVRATADFEGLASGFKRIHNILVQAGISPINTLFTNPNMLVPGPEKDLYSALGKVRSEVYSKDQHAYKEKLIAVSSLRPHVDLFFDKILVNDPDPAIRQNRLALLQNVIGEFSNIADLSEIVTQGASV